MQTLVVAAYPPELERLTERAGMIARAVGVGLVAASAGAERAIWETRPGRILIVGTAGVLPGADIAVGGMVVAARSELVVRPGEYVPPILTCRVEADEALAGRCAELLSVPRVTVACPMGITSSDGEAARLAATGAAVEHLEAFAVLAAAARANLPATAILAIANQVGSQAAAQWRANRVAAEAAAVAAVDRILANFGESWRISADLERA